MGSCCSKLCGGGSDSECAHARMLTKHAENADNDNTPYGAIGPTTDAHGNDELDESCAIINRSTGVYYARDHARAQATVCTSVHCR